MSEEAERLSRLLHAGRRRTRTDAALLALVVGLCAIGPTGAVLTVRAVFTPLAPYSDVADALADTAEKVVGSARDAGGPILPASVALVLLTSVFALKPKVRRYRIRPPAVRLPTHQASIDAVAKRFHTFGPDRVELGLGTGLLLIDEQDVDDGGPTLRILVVGAELVSPAARVPFETLLAERFAELAGTGRVGARVRSLADFLFGAALSEDLRVEEGEVGSPLGVPVISEVFLPLYVAWSISGRLLVAPIALATKTRRARLASAVSVAGAELLRTAAPAEDARAERARARRRAGAIAAYTRDACEPLLQMGVLPTDLLAGLERWQGGPAEEASVPPLSERASLDEAFALLVAHHGQLDALPPQLRRAPWHDLVAHAFADHFAARTAEIARRVDPFLRLGPAPIAATAVLVAVVAALDDGHAAQLAAAIDPSLVDEAEAISFGPSSERVVRATLATLLVAAALERGWVLDDPRVVQSVRLSAGERRVLPWQMATSAMVGGEGAAAMRGLAAELAGGRDGAVAWTDRRGEVSAARGGGSG